MTNLIVATIIWAGVATAAAPHSYVIFSSGGEHRAVNREQGMSVRFLADRSEFRVRDRQFSLRLIGWGPVAGVAVEGRRIEMAHEGVREWFVNEAGGVEQGFTVERKPEDGLLTVEMEVEGDLWPALEGGEVVLRGEGVTVGYGGLKSWDAKGRVLTSRAEVEGRRVRLVVDDRGAEYPVTVDPVVQQAKLRPADLVDNDYFSLAIAVDGDTAAVLSRGATVAIGGVYVYKLVSGQWVQQAKLVPNDPANLLQFGSGVAINGGTIAFTAVQSDLSGVVYVFALSGGVWSQQAKIVPPDQVPGEKAGSGLALSGETLAVSASNWNRDVGRVYVYARSGVAWALEATFTGSGCVSGHRCGERLAMSGGTLVVNSHYENMYTGAVYVFTRVGSSWVQQAKVTASDAASGYNFGALVAIEGDLMMISSPQRAGTGAVYAFQRTGSVWTQQAMLTASDVTPDDLFGGPLVLRGNVLVVGAGGYKNRTGAAYVFTRGASGWIEQAKLTAADGGENQNFAIALGLSGSDVLAGSLRETDFSGSLYVFRMSNVAVTSTPAGRAFTVSGAGCGDSSGRFVTPYAGFWTNCTVQWASPDGQAGANTRYVFQNWGDGVSQNPRTFTPEVQLLTASTYSGSFQTQYELAVRASPVSGGTVSGGGFYAAGTSAGVAAIPAVGFVFTGFSGDLSGSGSPQTVTMSGPMMVTGNFAPTPPAVLTALVTAKSGVAANRAWTLTMTNGGPGIAYGAQLGGVMLTQTFGTVCAPVRLWPAAFPIGLGTIAPGGTVAATVNFDFSTCATNARFTVSTVYVSNGGSSVGLIQLVNQFQ